MLKNLLYFATVLMLFLFSCKTPEAFLKPTARFDTLNIQLDVRRIQQYEYRLALEQKMQKFVNVYNTETHSFKLSFNQEQKAANCTVDFLRIRFISRKQSNVAMGITAAGLGTAAYLIASKFVIPFGWIYIPNSKTSLTPKLNPEISNISEFPKISVISTGMYRSLDKQIDLQSTKVVKYIVTIVQNLEKEYEANNR
jgi:hypothetical protein